MGSPPRSRRGTGTGDEDVNNIENANADLAEIERTCAAYGSADVTACIERLTCELRLLRRVRAAAYAVDTGALESHAWRDLRAAQRDWTRYSIALEAEMRDRR